MKNTAVLGWGRMNPPTIGHNRLIETIYAAAHQYNATPLVYLSHTQDKQKNPLPYKLKIGLARKAFGDIVQESNARTIMQVLKEVNKTHKNLIMITGSDRVYEFDILLHNYNHVEYNFERMQVLSCGERDPDGDAISAISASAMRNCAANLNITAFNSGLPPTLQNETNVIFDEVRKGLQL